MEKENGECETENMKGKVAIPIHGGKYVRYNILGNFFDVYAKYSPPIQPVGRGAYGIVWYHSHFLFLLFNSISTIFLNLLKFLIYYYYYYYWEAVRRIRRRKKVLRSRRSGMRSTTGSMQRGRFEKSSSSVTWNMITYLTTFSFSFSWFC